MSAIRIKKTPYQRQTENILQHCRKNVLRAYQAYREDLSNLQDDVKDSIDVITQEIPFS